MIPIFNIKYVLRFRFTSNMRLVIITHCEIHDGRFRHVRRVNLIGTNLLARHITNLYHVTPKFIIL